MDQVGTVGDLHRRADALYCALTAEIDAIEDPLLENLRFADELLHHVERLRTLLLDHARLRGTSWAAISAATGVPIGTWRSRHTRPIHTERTV